MFGYVTANKQELRLRELDVYQSYYCGLCRSLKKQGGRMGQLTLSYDMTFLILLLTGLYEPETQLDSRCCGVHPFQKHAMRRNEFSQYAADMNILMSYYNFMDDWQDERKFTRYLLALLLRPKCRLIEHRYPEKSKRIQEFLLQLSDREHAGERDVDVLSGCFGRLMAELFAVQQDLWEQPLRKVGFYLGKFIYLADAYEDVEMDLRSGSCNPFSEIFDLPDFEEKAYQLLHLMMSDCAAAFEYLPVLENAEIMRNILYSGVWSRYEMTRKNRSEKREKTDGRSL